MKLQWQKYSLHFKQPAGTSRGVLRSKDSYFIQLQSGEKLGVGECGLLRGLSADDRGDYETTLQWLADNIQLSEEELFGELEEFPSIQAGLEMALLDLEAENHCLFPSDFTAGRAGQAINGLIWMGDLAFMKKQVAERLENGFTVLKMKIGAIGLAEEVSILSALRNEYRPDELELRVDANGAFAAGEALGILNRLAELEIHSIEQPIASGNWQEMARLCEASALPVALDEELIGLFSRMQREKMISTIRPQYIILKPSFIGGFRGAEEWIALAGDHNCGWWTTSALESNLGLNAIAQWNYLQENPLPSGLGTGSLYSNNFDSPLMVKKGQIFYEPERAWKLDPLLQKWQ